jgi:predicted phosphohydrolase
MVDDMPRTELVLALYMTKQLVHGNQDFIASSYAKERCVLPMGLFEQVGLL